MISTAAVTRLAFFSLVIHRSWSKPSPTIVRRQRPIYVVCMLFTSPLARGVLVQRYKRFFDEVALDDGTQMTAHCPNPGRNTVGI